MAQPRGPLAGVKVVAYSSAQAGTIPYVLLADLGAEVSKTELPGGGTGRRGSSLRPRQKSALPLHWEGTTCPF